MPPSNRHKECIEHADEGIIVGKVLTRGLESVVGPIWPIKALELSLVVVFRSLTLSTLLLPRCLQPSANAL